MRQSTISDIKAKVSKWTKVKAAFKWERANVTSFNENKSTDSGIGLAPVNNEIARYIVEYLIGILNSHYHNTILIFVCRYLRVPSVPCTGSSGDSVLSSSSGGHLLSGGSSIPATPGTLSSASSVEELDVHHHHNRKFY